MSAPVTATAPLALHERLPATVGSVALARAAVRRFAAELAVDRDGLVLAVSEAVANSVLHAYDEPASGMVELSVTASGHDLTVVVRDFGGGLRPDRTGSRGAGLGLALIHQLAQDVDLREGPGGVELTMRFPAASAGSAGGSPEPGAARTS